MKNMEQRLKAAHRAIFWWKYAAIALATITAIILQYIFRGIQWDEFLQSVWDVFIEQFFAAAGVSFLLALFYDLVVRRVEEDKRKLEQEELVNALAVKVLLERAAKHLDEAEIESVAQGLIQNPRFREALATRTTNGPAHAQNMLQSYIEQLWGDGASLVTFKKWENWLEPDPHDPSVYHWTSSQTFTIPNQVNVYRVAITDDGILGDVLINSGIYFHNIVVIGKNYQDKLEKLLPKFKLSLATPNGGAIAPTKAIIPNKVKFSSFWPNGVVPTEYRGKKIQILEFEISGNPVTSSYVFEFTVPCSLDEPLFVVEAERACFIESMSIDYSKIAHLLDEVFPSNFIVNKNSKPDHDPDTRVFKCEVEGLIFGGHGIAIVWRRKP